MAYCLEVWGSASKTVMQPLFLMQKRTINLITFSAYRASTALLFRSCRVLTLEEMHVYKVLIFMFKVHHNMAPDIFLNFFYNQCNVSQLRD